VGVSRDGPNFFQYSLGTGKATNFKFGMHSHANKSPLKFGRKGSVKRERERIQGLPKFFQYPLSQERVKLRTSNLAGTFTGSIRIKAQ